MSRSLLVIFAVVLVVGANAFTPVDLSLSVNTVIPGSNVIGAGLTFNTAGDLFYRDHTSGCLKVFKNAAALPFGGTINFNSVPCVYTFFNGLLEGIVISKGGRLYMTQGQEVDPATGATLRLAWNNCNAQHGIALDPTDGSIIFSDYGGRKLYRVPNPDLSSTTYNPCGTPFADTNALGSTGCDGVAVGPDGTVYCAGYDAATVLIISKTGSLVGVSHSGKPAGSGPDGISVCAGNGTNFVITSLSNSFAIGRVNLTGPGGSTATPPYAFSIVATNTGGYNDWTAVDPKGCIWGSTVNGIGGVYRINNADGSCPNCNSAQVQSTTGCDCSEVKTFPNPGSTAQTDSFSSTSNCAALNFS